MNAKEADPVMGKTMRRARRLALDGAKTMRRARRLALDGAKTVGPVMTAAILEFAAAELQDRAREDGAWDEERYRRYSSDNESARFKMRQLRAQHGKVEPL